MEKNRKKVNNRNNYLRNREKILLRAKERWKSKSKKSSNVIPFFNREASQDNISGPAGGARRKKLIINKEALFILPMVALMTYYLISESAKFYQFAEGDQSGAYFKAMIAEGTILIFSNLRANTQTLRRIYRGVLLLAGFYSLWSLSAKTLSEGINLGLQAIQNQRAIVQIETDLAKRIENRDRFFSLNRLTMGRSYERSIDDLQGKLDRLRDSVKEVGSPIAILNTILSLILFRSFVMIANALLVHRLKRGIIFRQHATFSH